MTARIVEVRQGLLKKNDQQAAVLRQRFAEDNVFVVNLVSGPGAGKTALLEKTLAELSADFRVGALVGDLATDHDAKRLLQSGAPVRQISTGTTCHLDATMIEDALASWDLTGLDILFIENVGNLVCPASYDLGENLRAVLLSVTEGEDKPVKYPTIFNSADVAVITKVDLAEAVQFDRAAALEYLNRIRPGITVIDTSARVPGGLDAWLDYLGELVSQNVVANDG